MNDEDYEIPKKNMIPAILRVVIDVSAQQNALFNLLVDYITKKGEIEDEIVATYRSDFAAARQDLQEVIFSEYGFDVNELLYYSDSESPSDDSQ